MQKGSHLLVSKTACRAGVCILQKLQGCQRVNVSASSPSEERGRRLKEIGEFHLFLRGTRGETEQENMQNCEPLPEPTPGQRSFPILTSSDYTNESITAHLQTLTAQT